MQIKNQIRKISNSFSNKNIYTAIEVEKYFKDLIQIISKEFNSDVAYLIWLNRQPEDYENKIERVFKTTNFKADKNFEWWKRNDNTYLPIKFSSSNIFSDNGKELSYRFLTQETPYTTIRKNDYTDCLLAEIKNVSQNISDKIEYNFCEFDNELLIINVGEQDNCDCIIILNEQKDNITENIKLENICYFLNSNVSNFLFKIKSQRDKFLPSFNECISNIDFSSPQYIESIINKISELFTKNNIVTKNDNDTYCSEIGIFERFANRINIIRSNYKSFYDNDVVREIFEKPLLISSNSKTAIEYVAFNDTPYYIDSTKNERRIYTGVIKETRSQFSIPLKTNNMLHGVLNIGLSINYGFLPIDRKILLSVSNFLAYALKQKKWYLIQKDFSDGFTKKLLFLKHDPLLLDSIDKYSTNPKVVTDIFFNYLNPIYNKIFNYKLLLTGFEMEHTPIAEIFNEAQRLLIKNYRAEDFKTQKDIKKIIPQDLKDSYIIKFDKKIFFDSIISILIYKIENCIRKINKGFSAIDIKISTRILLEDGFLQIVFDDNGIAEDSDYLAKQFNSMDYPAPLKVKLNGKGHKLYNYYGIPFATIEYFLNQINSNLLIEESNLTNRLIISIPQNMISNGK